MTSNVFKKARMSSSYTQHVFVSCFDDPDKFVEVDMSLIEPIRCRLALSIKNSEEELHASGKRFYRAGSGMTRAMLTTLIKSLTLGRLVLSKGVEIGEALRVFDYEGISINKKESSSICTSTSGVAFAKHETSALDCVHALCERIADAIIQWPHLELLLNSIVPDTSRYQICKQIDVTTTATRIWMRFADRPQNNQTEGDTAMNLAKKNPLWLEQGLIALGILHYRMCKEEVESVNASENSSTTQFKKLYRRVGKDNLQSFFVVRFDRPYIDANDEKTKDEFLKGRKFQTEIRNTLLNNDSNPHLYSKSYARSVIMLVDRHRISTPLCGRIFSGLCADDVGNTPERTLLKKALKTRGVNIVKWVDNKDPHINPIVFPPTWRDNSNATCYGPSVLLSFESLI